MTYGSTYVESIGAGDRRRGSAAVPDRMERSNSMNRCSRCSTIPESPPSTGTLYLAPPLAHTLARLRQALRGLGIPFDEAGPRSSRSRSTDGRLDAVLDDAGQDLSEAERRDTRSLILAEGGRRPRSTDPRHPCRSRP